MRALSTAATGMLAQQLNVDVISNNIANLNTSGFKRSRAEFQDLLYQNVERPGSQSSTAGTVVPSGIQVGVGVQTAGVYRIAEQGSLEITGNQLDLAINGRGFFRIQLPDGQDAFTRAGSFQLDQLGQLVTPEGFLVQPAVAIPLDATSITISLEGEIQATLDGQVQPQILGQLDLVTFPNEVGLDSFGANLFLETQASGPANQSQPGQPGFGEIQQGFLERANVNAVQELTSLITAQRAFELNSTVIQTADQMLQAANQIGN